MGKNEVYKKITNDVVKLYGIKLLSEIREANPDFEKELYSSIANRIENEYDQVVATLVSEGNENPSDSDVAERFKQMMNWDELRKEVKQGKKEIKADNRAMAGINFLGWILRNIWLVLIIAGAIVAVNVNQIAGFILIVLGFLLFGPMTKKK